MISFKIPTIDDFDVLEDNDIIYVRNNNDTILGILFSSNGDWCFLKGNKLDPEDCYDSIVEALVDNNINEGYLDIVKINEV